MEEPKYKLGDTVKFTVVIKGKQCTKEGKVYIIDKYGTFENPNVVSYDILVHNDEHLGNINENTETAPGDCLYKHIPENLLIE